MNVFEDKAGDHYDRLAEMHSHAIRAKASSTEQSLTCKNSKLSLAKMIGTESDRASTLTNGGK